MKKEKALLKPLVYITTILTEMEMSRDPLVPLDTARTGVPAAMLAVLVLVAARLFQIQIFHPLPHLEKYDGAYEAVFDRAGK